MSKKEQTIDYAIVTPDGTFCRLDDIDQRKIADLPSTFARYVSLLKGERQELMQNSASYMQLAVNKGYIQYPAQVKGGLFYMPKGMVIYDAILAFADQMTRKNGFVKIGIPFFFQSNTDTGAASTEVMGHLTQKFTDYLIGTDVEKDVYLRYASDPLLFWLLQGRKFDTAQNPIRIYSPGDFFRNERTGELSGLKRTRSLHLTDYHIVCMNGREEFKSAHTMNVEAMDTLCKDWFLVSDVEAAFFNENREFLTEIVALAKRPAVFKIMKERTHYYSLQNQYTYGLADGTSTQIANLQLDFINGPKFDIRLGEGYAAIVHGTVTGRMEKVVLVLFDQAVQMMERRDSPMLPIWLAPTQVRILPVSQTYLEYALSVFADIEAFGIRCDIDERDLAVREKIRSTEQEWIPYTAIIGEKERMSNVLSVRRRKARDETVGTKDLAAEVTAVTKNYPFVPRPFSHLMSRQTLL